VTSPAFSLFLLPLRDVVLWFFKDAYQRHLEPPYFRPARIICRTTASLHPHLYWCDFRRTALSAAVAHAGRAGRKKACARTLHATPTSGTRITVVWLFPALPANNRRTVNSPRWFGVVIFSAVIMNGGAGLRRWRSRDTAGVDLPCMRPSAVTRTAWRCDCHSTRLLPNGYHSVSGDISSWRLSLARLARVRFIARCGR